MCMGSSTKISGVWFCLLNVFRRICWELLIKQHPLVLSPLKPVASRRFSQLWTTNAFFKTKIHWKPTVKTFESLTARGCLLTHLSQKNNSFLVFCEVHRATLFSPHSLIIITLGPDGSAQLSSARAHSFSPPASYKMSPHMASFINDDD